MSLGKVDLEVLREAYESIGRSATGDDPSDAIQRIIRMNGQENVPEEVRESLRLLESGDLQRAKLELGEVLSEAGTE